MTRPVRKIVNIAEYKESKRAHLEGETKCLVCGHKEMVVAPVTHNFPLFECGNCGLWHSYFMYGCWPEQGDIFYCDCGSDTFCLRRSEYRDGSPFYNVLCLGCGVSHGVENILT